ncbi:Acg family FMN-binding oxidoreductase [Nocardia nova]|uniref:Acg family FMN-binding oxidoreductase n=1 Tax=Nocardia nova TaxID=37330 RepID=UPI003408FFD6
MTTTAHSETRGRPDARMVEQTLQLAQRAPSVHNTQPWRWHFDGERLYLRTDPDRRLPATDPHGREQIISCGAVLHHARTVFAARGWHTDIVRFPDPGHPGRLAVLDFRPWPNPPAGIAVRAAAIPRRYTDRLPMGPPRNWPELVAGLQRLAWPHDLSCDALADDIRAQVAAVSTTAATARHDDWMYQDELNWWTGHSGTSEGVPPGGLISDAELARVDVARVFPSAPHSERRPGRVDEARLLALGSPDESPGNWLHTGEALSAVLLECTAAGMGTCPVTHLTEVPAGRRALAALLPHHDFPQVLIRIGTTPPGEQPPPATPRRRVGEVLTVGRGHWSTRTGHDASHPGRAGGAGS